MYISGGLLMEMTTLTAALGAPVPEPPADHWHVFG